MNTQALLTPNNAMNRVRYGIDRMFDTMVPAFVRNIGLTDARLTGPSVNLIEDDDRLYVEAELPGVAMEDLEITVADNTLTIGGARSLSVRTMRRRFVRTRRPRLRAFPRASDPGRGRRGRGPDGRRCPAGHASQGEHEPYPPHRRDAGLNDENERKEQRHEHAQQHRLTHHRGPDRLLSGRRVPVSPSIRTPSGHRSTSTRPRIDSSCSRTCPAPRPRTSRSTSTAARSR